MRIVLLCLTFCSFPLFAESPLTADQWLARMERAAQQENYQGVIVSGLNQHWDSLQVRHAQIDGKEYEHLLRLNQKAQELIRQGEESVCYHQGKLKLHSPLKNPLRLRIPEQIVGYDLVVGAHLRLAGRSGQEVLIRPKDALRYGMRLWLDEATGLLLGLELLNERGVVLERAQYAQIQIGEPIAADTFQSTLPGHALANKTQAAEIALVDWQPRWLPEGFVATQAKQQQQAVRLMYSDGLAAFSVFVDEVPAAVPHLVRQWGATNAVLLQVQHNEVRRRITAVGELPASTLEQIALSVAPLAKVEHTEQ